jgi:CheY-like chemotaxis protein
MMWRTEHPILVVEDSDEDFATTSRILKKFGSFVISRCAKGTEVMEKLSRQQPDRSAQIPQLILLDLNLPGKKGGGSVLVDLKANASHRRIPVVVMTTSENPHDVRHCFDHGAAGYMVKPVDLDKFTERIETLVKYWFEVTTLPAKVEAV